MHTFAPKVKSRWNRNSAITVLTFRCCGNSTSSFCVLDTSLLPILLNSVPCGADGLLGDAHDAADVLVFQAHLVENEEEGVVGGIGSVFLLDAADKGEVDGLIVVDEAFVVVVRLTRSGAVFFYFIV